MQEERSEMLEVRREWGHEASAECSVLSQYPRAADESTLNPTLASHRTAKLISSVADGLQDLARRNRERKEAA